MNLLTVFNIIKVVRLTQNAIEHRYMHTYNDINNINTVPLKLCVKAINPAKNTKKLFNQCIFGENLVLNYYLPDVGTFVIPNVCGFDRFQINIADQHLKKQREKELGFIFEQFSTMFEKFNNCKILDNYWEDVDPDHILFEPGIRTSRNKDCDRAIVPYFMYRRFINNVANFLIIHKSAILKKFFRWSGVVFIGKNTNIGFGVFLENGVVVSNTCGIGDWTHIESNSLLCYKSVVCANLRIGNGNIIGSYAIIYRNIYFITEDAYFRGIGAYNAYIPYIKYEELRYFGSCNIIKKKVEYEVQMQPIFNRIIHLNRLK